MWNRWGSLLFVAFLLCCFLELTGSFRVQAEALASIGPEADNADLYWDDQFGPSGAGMGSYGYVNALLVVGTDLYAGGNFTTAGGVSANYIAKWDGTAWSTLGSGMNGAVRALAVIGNDLYAGGDFTTAGGVPANRCAKWNGASWSALGSGVNGYIYALAPIGSNLYAGGYFTTAGGISAKSIAKWNGSTWSTLAGGMNNDVYALATIGSDLYAGGVFTTANGITVNRIAKWNGSAWSALGAGMNNTVWALAVSDGNLYAGGHFTTADGLTANRVAKWNGTWSALGTGFDSQPYALAANGSDLYAGGLFTQADGASANRVAKWNGGTWSPLGSGVDSLVNALAVNGNCLAVGGIFANAGGKPSSYFALLQPRVNVASATVTANPGAMTVGNDPRGFCRPALTFGAGTVVSYSGGLPRAITLDRADEIRVGGKRVNGAFTLGPEGMQFSGTGATLRIEFSQDDVAAYSGATYQDFRAVRLAYPAGYPADKEAVNPRVKLSDNTATPIRIDNGQQIYAITIPFAQIGSTYAAIPLSQVPVEVSRLVIE